MELKHGKVLKTFTVLSLAAAVLMGFQYVGKHVYLGILEILNKNQEAGVFRWLSWLFHSPWTDTLVQYLFLMGVAYVPIYLLICRLPKDDRPVRKLSGKDFLVGTVMAMGLGYAFNILGTFINFWISTLTDSSILEMNPVVEMMDSLTPSMLMYTCIVGPFMEELMCRGFLLKRARMFGDWTAVVYTSVIFGLMHGNIAQFLYATVIGLIFGYVAVKTNGIRYTVLMHMVINTYNAGLAWGETVIFETDSEILTITYSLAILLNMAVLIVSGVILMVKYGTIWYTQMYHHDGVKVLTEDGIAETMELRLGERLLVYLNPGFVIYFVLCLIEFAYYLL